jgi:hypothetical protein
MAVFKRVKVVATIESPMMLIDADEMVDTMNEVHSRLRELGLSVVTMDTVEPAAGRHPEDAYSDLWA